MFSALFAGGDLPDMAAGALSRGLLIPKKMAEALASESHDLSGLRGL